MDIDNLVKQKEELETLSAIYGEDLRMESEEMISYTVKIEVNKYEVMLYVTLPEKYPTLEPPKYELSAPWMDRRAKTKLQLSLDGVYANNIGETVIFQLVEKIRESLQRIKKQKKILKTVTKPAGVDSSLNINCPDITHGDVITDRKSVFQGHAAEVHSIEEVKAVLMKLKTNNKILNAKHNMYVYRIESNTSKGTTILQDYDDDGEAHAGGRLLHLMQILDQKNTLVVVTRWYGGIQLGPDRFRHINNAARKVIEQAGLLRK